jgi:hypothetical protein
MYFVYILFSISSGKTYVGLIILKEDFKNTTSLKPQDLHFVTDHGPLFARKNMLQNRKPRQGSNFLKLVEVGMK